MKEIANGPYSRELDDQQKQQVLTAFKQKGEKDLLGAADLLRRIIEQIISRDPAYNGTKKKKKKFSNTYSILGGKNVNPKYDKKTLKEAIAEWLNIFPPPPYSSPFPFSLWN